MLIDPAQFWFERLFKQSALRKDPTLPLVVVPIAIVRHVAVFVVVVHIAEHSTRFFIGGRLLVRHAVLAIPAACEEKVQKTEDRHERQSQSCQFSETETLLIPLQCKRAVS